MHILTCRCFYVTLLVGYCQYGNRISLVTSRAPRNVPSGLWLWGKRVLAAPGQCKVSTLTWLHIFSELRSILFHANGCQKRSIGERSGIHIKFALKFILTWVHILFLSSFCAWLSYMTPRIMCIGLRCDHRFLLFPLVYSLCLFLCCLHPITQLKSKGAPFRILDFATTTPFQIFLFLTHL